ncbi:hypothetical protein E4U13_007408 [Claviceps humidiphila]|uniref:60S ribosomal protein L13 n=1 Tax=Claviceps humidiphila TaxID=1294629 RepID=A0A9P7Q6L7_9HYPO|nr:hypothetical protein E4U13_007408 [Claviceps humidiphila]
MKRWHHRCLLHVDDQAVKHNENEKEIKNYAPHGPEGQWSTERLRAVQCRPPILNPPNLELGNLEQGKYEEEEKRKGKLRTTQLNIYSVVVAWGTNFLQKRSKASMIHRHENPSRQFVEHLLPPKPQRQTEHRQPEPVGSHTGTMAIKHNQKIVNNHFRKDWQRRVRTHFDQPGKKASRRVARQAKAAALAPRPVDKLRPIVRCPTIKYNRKVRAGRGFTLTELKEAGIARPLARTIGISVDHRRQNLSEESLAINVARLKAYRERLILLPRKSNAPKKGDTKTDISQINRAATVSSVLPIAPTDLAVKEIQKSEMPAPIEGGAYATLRAARSNKRYQGAREKRIRDKAEAESASKK